MARFGPKTGKMISKIQDQLNKLQITTKMLHKILDIDGNGSLSKGELVENLGRALQLKDLQSKDIGDLFDKMDVNDNGSLSVLEFSLYIEGAKLEKAQRLNNIDPETEMEFKNEIKQLFKHFDRDGNGEVSAEEI